ncbi:MAG: hypothetical protein ACLGI6_14250, partial [Gammaproteobacteria bacterium]
YPLAYYPFFIGYAHERGHGAGEGANLNLPLAPGTGDARADQLEQGKAYLNSLAAGTVVETRTLFLYSDSGTPPAQPIVISAPAAEPGTAVALVIDARNVAPGSVIKLENVDF